MNIKELVEKYGLPKKYNKRVPVSKWNNYGRWWMGRSPKLPIHQVRIGLHKIAIGIVNLESDPETLERTPEIMEVFHALSINIQEHLEILDRMILERAIDEHKEFSKPLIEKVANKGAFIEANRLRRKRAFFDADHPDHKSVVAKYIELLGDSVA